MRILKTTIIIAGITLAILSMIYGSFLPLIKSKRYITAARSLSSIRSVDEFTRTFDHVFDFYSPVGDEEVVKFVGNSVLGIASTPGQQEDIARLVVSYMEPKIHKDNVRHRLLLARMYTVLFQNYGKAEDLRLAEQNFLAAHELGPRLPQPLYALLEIYRITGETEKMGEIAEQIVTYWPEDTRIQRVPLPQ